MKLASMTWEDVARVASTTVAILPIAAVEQHGPHLPVTTDTDLVTSIATAVEQELPSEVILCPTLPYGSSGHHLNFAGTMSLGPELFTRVVIDLLSSLVDSGFRRMVLLNGHGGNAVPARQALAVLSKDLGPETEIALVTYWELAGRTFAGAPPMESPALSHACEYETSMMLKLASERVQFHRVERARRPPVNEYIAWEDESPFRGVSVVRRTEFLSSNGASGEPQRATQEKGEHLLNEAAAALVRFVRSFSGWKPMENLRNA